MLCESVEFVIFAQIGAYTRWNKMAAEYEERTLFGALLGDCKVATAHVYLHSSQLWLWRHVTQAKHGSLHRLLTTLHSARLPHLHKLFHECEQLIVANQKLRFRSIVLEVRYNRLFFPVRRDTNSTAKPLRRFINLFFHNKGIDKVKLTAILHNKLVRSKVPIYFQEQDPPLVSYKYTNNISRSVFNYNQTLRNINLDDYRNASSSCDCESSAFRYEPHGHVMIYE